MLERAEANSRSLGLKLDQDLVPGLRMDNMDWDTGEKKA